MTPAADSPTIEALKKSDVDTRLHQELAHLVSMSHRHPNWHEYAEAKAKALQKMEPMWIDLPKLLQTALDCTKHGPRRNYTRGK